MKKSKGLAESNSDTKLLSKTASTAGGGAPTLASLRTLMKDEKKGSKSEKKSLSRTVRNEKQGPIDWSHFGIKLKYRGEREREQLWVEWKKNAALAMTMINSEGMVVPIVKVQRHPIIELYYDRLSIENNSSNERTKSRLLMKKFVLDVQEIWMSNLAHLKEHNTAFLTTYGSKKIENNGNSKPGSREQPGSSSIEEDEVEEQNFARGDGLSYRRDVKEIKSYSHQIQSVSQKRIFTKAYHTAKLPAVNVMLDYVASQPPIITGIKPIIPKLQCLLSSLSLLPLSSPSSSSSASYQLLDTSPCLKSSLAFHIDRLVPSNDFSFYFKDDNYWRFSIIHSESLLHRVYITTEYEITSFVTQFIQEKNYLSSQEEADQPYYEELYCSETPIIIPYEDGREEWSGILRVFMMYENKIEKMFKFVISTELYPINQINSDSIPPISLNFFFSSLEIRSILNQPFFPILDKAWWLSSSERMEDVWKPLLFGNHLLLELDYSEGRGIPVSIGWKLPKDQSGLLTGGTAGYSESLTIQQALSCLSELLSAISVQRVEGNDNDELPHLYFLRENGQQLLKLKELTAGKDDPSVIRSFPWNITATRQDVIENEEGINRVEEIAENEPIIKEQSQQQESEEDMSPSSSSWQEKTKEYFNSGNWEFILELGPNNSFIGNQLYLKYCEIPGGCEIGRKGLGWLKDAVFPSIHRTQVAANFFRDFEHSSTNTIFVHLSLALDYSLLFQPLLVMESFSQLPPPTVADDPPEVIACTVLKNTMISREYLASPIEKRLSKTIIIFESYPREGMDYLRRTTPSKPSGYRRHLPIKNEYGFREQIEVSLLQIDPVNEVVVFGITENAAIPNETRTNGRNIWHSSVAVNENINR
jgi:hypothetical protein